MQNWILFACIPFARTENSHLKSNCNSLHTWWTYLTLVAPLHEDNNKMGTEWESKKTEITKIITYKETATKKTCTSIAYTLYLTFRITPNIHILLIMAIIDILFIWFLSQKQWQTLNKSLCHTMGKIREWVSEWKKIEGIDSVHHCRCISIWPTCRVYWTHQSGDKQYAICLLMW